MILLLVFLVANRYYVSGPGEIAMMGQFRRPGSVKLVIINIERTRGVIIQSD